MAEDPEEVLPQERVGAGFGIEELRVELAIEQQKQQGDRDDRQGERQQELGDQQHPGQHRHAHEVHARRAEVEAGHDQVDRRDQRGDTCDQQADHVEVDPVGRREGDTAVRRVAEPTTVGATTTDDPRAVEEKRTGQPHPERQGVQTGEGDVAGTDLQRDQVVGEGGGHRHDEQEDHRDAVHREDLVVKVGTQQALFRERELRADQQGLEATHEEEEHRGDAVHDADLLVVDRADPVLPATLGLRTRQHTERTLRVLLTAGEGKRFFDDRHAHSTSVAAMSSADGLSPRVSR